MTAYNRESQTDTFATFPTHQYRFVVDPLAAHELQANAQVVAFINDLRSATPVVHVKLIHTSYLTRELIVDAKPSENSLLQQVMEEQPEKE